MNRKRVVKTDYVTKRIYGGNVRITAPGGGKMFVRLFDVFYALGSKYMAIHDTGRGCRDCCFGGKCGKYKDVFGSCLASERPDHVSVIFYRLGKA